VRRSRQAIIAGEGTIYYSLGDDQIAALDAIGFVWVNGAMNAEEANSPPPPTNLTTVSPLMKTDKAPLSIATSTEVTVTEILRSDSVEAMIKQGNAISIMVAPRVRLGLTITVRPGSGARIDAIERECPLFKNEVSVSDTIVTINDKEVMTSADFSVGLECTRKLGIIPSSMQGDMGTKIETNVCVENYEKSTNIDHSGKNSPERSRKLNLVPLTRLECEQALLANKITYPEPEYLVGV
jgi:hypothetical protein